MPFLLHLLRRVTMWWLASACDLSMGETAIRLSEFVPRTYDVLKGVESIECLLDRASL